MEEIENELEPQFPIEFIVEGTPVSLQGSPRSKKKWKERVKKASSAVLSEGHFATHGKMALTLYYFPADKMQGDVDNIVKLVLDALSKHVYMDDSQVERVVVHKFEPGTVFAFRSPSAKLVDAINGPKPALYVRVSDDPIEDLK